MIYPYSKIRMVGAPERIRTSDLRIRSLYLSINNLLYPPVIALQSVTESQINF